MPTGVGAVTVVNDPSVQSLDFVQDPRVFFDLTEKNVYRPISFDAPGSGASVTRQLPQAGILGMLRILFVGTITITVGGGSVTTRGRWPYGLLDRFVLSANAQNDVYNVRGEDLEILRRIRGANGAAANPADVIPGGFGPGQTLTNGANAIALTWEAPIAIDQTTLIGAIYAQSAAMNLQASVYQAATTSLLAAAGGATIDSVTGTFYIEVESFDIPIVGQDRPSLVVPDVTRLHVVQGFDTAYANTGEVPTSLIRGNGQLDRLIVSVTNSDPNTGTTSPYLSPLGTATGIDAVRIEYGNSQRPLDRNPAAFLAAENAQRYGGTLLPYGAMVFDFLAENPPRDIIQMAGVTDLRVVPTVDGAVTVNANSRVRAVQEMLIG